MLASARMLHPGRHQIILAGQDAGCQTCPLGPKGPEGPKWSQVAPGPPLGPASILASQDDVALLPGHHPGLSCQSVQCQKSACLGIAVEHLMVAELDLKRSGWRTLLANEPGLWLDIF